MLILSLNMKFILKKFFYVIPSAWILFSNAIFQLKETEILWRNADCRTGAENTQLGPGASHSAGNKRAQNVHIHTCIYTTSYTQ